MELKDGECKVKALQKTAPHIITGILHFIYCALQILEGFFFFKKLKVFSNQTSSKCHFSKSIIF